MKKIEQSIINDFYYELEKAINKISEKFGLNSGLINMNILDDGIHVSFISSDQKIDDFLLENFKRKHGSLNFNNNNIYIFDTNKNYIFIGYNPFNLRESYILKDNSGNYYETNEEILNEFKEQ